MNNIVIILGVVITLATGIPVMTQIVRQHPKGLFVLFFAEMWERFSYYGMRGLLVFYLIQHFLFDDAFAATQYGSYTSLVYLLPLIGGILADRYLGTRKSILFGAVLLTIGQLAMAATAAPATETLTYKGHQYDFRSRAAWRPARCDWWWMAKPISSVRRPKAPWPSSSCRQPPRFLPSCPRAATPWRPTAIRWA